MSAMQSLEAKIPPPLIAVLVAAAMWGISLSLPTLNLLTAARLSTAAALALVGGSFGVAGILSFRRARTTVNPMKPEATSALVSSGIYRVTRNPMYVGLLIDLVAWAVFLSSAWALLGPVFFLSYISRFQIAPEERALDALFGVEYSDYKSKVRRWL